MVAMLIVSMADKIGKTVSELAKSDKAWLGGRLCRDGCGDVFDEKPQCLPGIRLKHDL